MGIPTRKSPRARGVASTGIQGTERWRSNGWKPDAQEAASEGTLEFMALRDYLSVLRRRKGTILIAALMGILGAVGYGATRAPAFTSSANVLVTNPLAPFVTGGQSATQPNMVNEQVRVGSLEVATCAQRILAHPTEDPASLCTSTVPPGAPVPSELIRHLSVSVSLNTNILKISYSAPKAAQAQQGAEAFAQAYVTATTLQADDKVRAIQGPWLAQVRRLNAQINALDAQIANLATPTAAKGPSPQLSALENQVQQLGQQLQLIQSNLTDWNSAKLAPPQLLKPANLPRGPSSPRGKLILGIGLVLGLLGGSGFVLVREGMSDAIRGREDLEEQAQTPVLAEIPYMRNWRSGHKQTLVRLTQGGTAFGESYRALAARVSIVATERNIKVIMVASAEPGEGKSSVAASLGAVLADAGRRVVLISSDLRRPRLASLFNLDDEVGLSNVLMGECSFSEALQVAPEFNVRVIGSGAPVAPQLPALFDSPAMARVIEEARQTADFVLMDSPPVLLVADALTLMRHVDGVLLVTNQRETVRKQVARMRAELHDFHAVVMGAVLNKTKLPSNRYRAYRYLYRAG